MKIDKTRHQILEVANQLFQKFGFEKTSMAEIAQAAHKAKRSLYNHFVDKEDLFCSVASEEMKKLHARLKPILEEGEVDTLSRLKSYFITRFELIAESGIYHVVLENVTTTQIGFRFGALQTEVDAFKKWEYDSLLRLWDQSTDIEVASPDSPYKATAFADMVQMLLSSLDYTFFVHNKYKEYKETYSFLVNMIINSLSNKIEK
ncbi:MAG: TetR/AcrR family transcriptional regulator [Bacteroidales bacterium]|nr:TetR/AcrR family transcriptional regulator [Bacteroidales bacterium]